MRMGARVSKGERAREYMRLLAEGSVVLFQYFGGNGHVRDV